MTSVQLEFPFTLPCGFVDAQGALHREGVMRRATARDELEALSHQRARVDESYAAVVLISRVVVRLGSLTAVAPGQVEELFAVDFGYLQDLYLQLNGNGRRLVETVCPTCGTRLQLAMGESEA